MTFAKKDYLAMGKCFADGHIEHFCLRIAPFADLTDAEIEEARIQLIDALGYDEPVAKALEEFLKVRHGSP